MDALPAGNTRCSGAAMGHHPVVNRLGLGIGDRALLETARERVGGLHRSLAAVGGQHVVVEGRQVGSRTAGNMGILMEPTSGPA